MALFVPLDASYAQDPKILDLEDERAELLFVRSLAHCKAHLTDGLVHRKSIGGIAPFSDEVAPAVLAAELVRVGLWAVEPRGWVVVAWLDHNPPSEEILNPSKGRELAHIRHHVNKGIRKEGCALCFPAEDPQVNAHDACVDAVRDAQDAMPEPEPYPEPQPTSTSSQDYTGSGPVTEPNPAAEVCQPTRQRAIRLVADLQAEGGDTPAALAASIRRRMADPTDSDRVRIEAWLLAGLSPEQIVTEWAANPLPAPVAAPGPSEAEVRDAARRREAESQAKLEEIRCAPAGDSRRGLAMARSTAANPAASDVLPESPCTEDVVER